MSIHHLFDSRLGFSFLSFFIFLGWFPGLIFSQVVTLDSIQIFTTHELFSSKPTVYFQCKGENKTVLPDVKKTGVLYNFKGEESWQPLTEFQDTKCKRCGFYEQNHILSDNRFDEWEFCPSDFTSEGRYALSKEKELNATFQCQGCEKLSASTNTDSSSHREKKGIHPALVILIVVVVSTVVILGAVAGYKYWLKRKRQQEQARFLKLFEDGDEIEDELGLGSAL